MSRYSFFSQFNALQDLATVPGSNDYGSKWRGPHTAVYPAAQLSVLDVLAAAVAFASSPTAPRYAEAAASPLHGSLLRFMSISASKSASATISGSAPSKSAGGDKEPNKRAIVGGVVGGVVGVLLTLATLFFCRKRDHQTHETLARAMLEHTPVPYNVEPIAISSRRPNGKMNPTSATILDIETQPHNPHAPLDSRPAIPQAPLSHSGPSAHRMNPASPDANADGRIVAADINAIPGLIDTLNIMLSTLPFGSEQGEQPPSYTSHAP